MGTLSPKDERKLLFGCAAIVVAAGVIIGSVGYAAFKLLEGLLL